jgi:hypothetical protein
MIIGSIKQRLRTILPRHNPEQTAHGVLPNCLEK